MRPWPSWRQRLSAYGVGNRVGRPESGWRALAAYGAMVGIALASSAVIVGLFWLATATQAAP